MEFKPNRLLRKNPSNPSTSPDQPRLEGEQVAPKTPETPQLDEGAQQRTALGDAIANNLKFRSDAKSYISAFDTIESDENEKRLAADLRRKAESDEVSFVELKGWEWMGIEDSNYKNKYSTLGKAYLQKLTDASNNDYFKVSPELNNTEKVKYGIGATDLLPPNITKIKVVDNDGNSAEGIRKIVGNKLGYYDESNQYIPIFGGYEIYPLESFDENLEDFNKKTDEEKEHHRTLITAYSKAENSSTSEDPSGNQDENNYTNLAYEDSEYPEDYKRKVVRRNIPKKIQPQEMYVAKTLGYTEGYKYWANIMGIHGDKIKESRPDPRWFVPGFHVFGTKIDRPNIILACLLKELEIRCKKKGIDTNFKYLTAFSKKPHYHGLGMAIDFDPAQNWVSTPENASWNIPAGLAIEAQKMGMGWGIYYKTTDPMHFTVQITLPQVMALLESKEAKELAQSFQVPGRNMSLMAYAQTFRSDQNYA